MYWFVCAIFMRFVFRHLQLKKHPIFNFKYDKTNKLCLNSKSLRKKEKSEKKDLLKLDRSVVEFVKSLI